jgi:uncharacterized protein YdaU (DUF1376 family)
MGNKDPAVLFYTSDFLTGVADLTMEERGQYITLLCMQHQKGHLSEKTICLSVGSVSVDVLRKFQTDNEGLYYQSRMDLEIDKRLNFIGSRAINGSKGGRPKKASEKLVVSKCKASEKLIENENDNDNKDIKHKYGSYKNVLLSDGDYEKLINDFPSDYKKRIEELSEGIASKGYKYKNHLATIRSWARREKEKPSGNPFKDKLKEMMQDEQSRDNSPHVGYQGGLSKLLQEPNRD